MSFVHTEIPKYYWHTFCWERDCAALNIIAAEEPIDDPDENEAVFTHCHNCGAGLKGWDQGWAEIDEERQAREGKA